ncbi:hypothetical protein SAMN04488118_1087 [Epibacterium ulvae]|uniref:Uncharacterized protein n=1 Tax=Epibacterium ulvae TaxID=1156985 RepID=A0A1G5R5D6_9RHOB|nr:hypothetical protein SAMN04488118_1087 [Epibacterium ulvae]
MPFEAATSPRNSSFRKVARLAIDKKTRIREALLEKRRLFVTSTTPNL